MFFKYFERNYYVQYSRFNVQRAEARHAAEPATADPRQPAKAGRKSQRQAERAAEVSHRAFELERPGFVPGLFCSDSKPSKGSPDERQRNPGTVSRAPPRMSLRSCGLLPGPF